MNQTNESPGNRRLRMQYAGGLVKHLGLSMYRGAVPALAELIANAWDADADSVKLTIPFDTGLTDEVDPSSRRWLRHELGRRGESLSGRRPGQAQGCRG